MSGGLEIPGGQEGFEEIFIDKEGQWFFRGAPIIRQEIVAFLSQHLVRMVDGSYWIRWKEQQCPVAVEDTPFVVWGVTGVDSDGKRVGVLLELNDGTAEMLNPVSLFIGPENVPYCSVREGEFRARFSRRAYYQLARMVEEAPGGEGFCLRLGERLYPIRQG
jgi:hypothetical protein